MKAILDVLLDLFEKIVVELEVMIPIFTHDFWVDIIVDLFVVIVIVLRILKYDRHRFFCCPCTYGISVESMDTVLNCPLANLTFDLDGLTNGFLFLSHVISLRVNVSVELDAVIDVPSPEEVASIRRVPLDLEFMNTKVMALSESG